MKQLIVIVGLLIALNACTSKKDKSVEAPAPQPKNEVTLTEAQLKNAGITTTTLQTKTISVILKVNGKIDVPPQQMVSVSAPLGGYLKSTKLLPGMHINKGETIAVMEDQQYIQLQQDYLLAKSALHFAELDYTRQKELNQSQASSDKVTQQAQAEVNKQLIMMNALAEKLKLININISRLSAENISKTMQLYSSISGYVSKVNVNIGKYVNPSEVLFELINPTDIHLNIKVFEKDVDKLFIGQKIIAYTNAQPAKKHLCEIILISKDIGEDGSTEVHCHFENFDKTLLPGMYMNAEIAVSTESNNTLPAESIVNFEGKDYVFIQKNKLQFEMREVKTGNAQNGFVEILSAGTLRDQTFVTKGAYTLLMKMKNSAEEE